MATPARPRPGDMPQGLTPDAAISPAAQPDAPRDITVIPRAVITAAVEVVHTVERAVGGGPIRSARDNAWEAVCADRALAQQRDEIRRVAAALHHSAVGSSPRSSAAQVTAVSARPAAGGPVPGRAS